jgi:hypothetical protein
MEEVSHWQGALEGYIWSRPLPLSLALLSGLHEVSSLLLPCLSAIILCFITGSETTEPSDHGLKALNP